MNGARPAPVLVLLMLLSLPAAAAPDGVRTAPAPVPRQAPGMVWVTPPSRVLLDCPAKSRQPTGILALGTALDQSGFQVEPRGGAARPEGLAAIVRCVERKTDAAPGPGPAPVEAAGPPVIEILPSLTDAEAIAAAGRLSALVGPNGGFPRPVRVLFLVDHRSDTDRTLLVQASWVVAYARLPADFLDLEHLDRLPGTWIDRYDAVVLATDRLPAAGADRLASALLAYARRGGAVAAVAGVEEESLYPLFGIEKREGMARIETFSCDPTFVPGAKGLDPVLPPDGADTVPAFRLSKDARVLCRGGTAGDLDVPLAFATRVGKGAAVGWAGARLADKSSRGLILLSLLEVAPLAASILDAFVFYADDCPLPMTNRPRPPADTLYGITDSEFYNTKWWPRMRALWQAHSVRPTTGFILTYDDHLPEQGVPQGYSLPDGAPSLELARAVRDAGYEVGLHGFNHQSLSVGRNEWTVGWAGRPQMETALKMLRDEFQRIFGPGAEPGVYIAPSNFIQKMGKQVLQAVFPRITGVASQYLDEGPILGQEFGPDPDVPGMVDLPRVTSEHFLDGANSQEMLDALVVPGVFSHFVHPDDFFDPERSRGADWDEMVRRLDEMLTMIDREYPFLRRMTGSELARYAPEWRKARLEVLRDASGLLVRAVDAPPGGLTVLVRAPRGTTVRHQGACEEAFRAPTESRYYYRIGSDACAISWQ